MLFTRPHVVWRVGTVQLMSLCALEMITDSPVPSVRCRAFTVMSAAPATVICSLITSVARAPSVMVWFGEPVTTTGFPAKTSPAIVLEPEAPAHSARVSAWTTPAESCAGWPGKARTLCTRAELVARLPEPLVEAVTVPELSVPPTLIETRDAESEQIGRASCRERG